MAFQIGKIPKLANLLECTILSVLVNINKLDRELTLDIKHHKEPRLIRSITTSN